MANALYGLGRQAFLKGLIDWTETTGSDIKIALIDRTDYTVSINVDQYMNYDTVPDAASIPGGISGNLASLTSTLGVADAANIVLTAVAAGDAADDVIVFMDGGDAGATQSGTNDLLIAYYDTFASGMPVTPNGGDITVAWHSSGLFAL